MKIVSKKAPVDIIICIIWSIILVPIALLDVDGTVRIVLGLPFILFIPGYILIFALFPGKKTDTGIDIIERIALSFGLSIAIVPLIGLGLNYTPWGIRLEPILFSIFIFIISIGSLAIYRWYKTDEAERFIINIDISFPESESRFDKALTIILAITILIAVVALIYVIVTPKVGEKFTEFYLLGPGGKASDYPRNLSINESGDIIIGVVNHEYKDKDYTVEIWLINQTIQIDPFTNESIVTYHHMYFMDKIQTSLNHTPIDIEGEWKPQWEYDYNFNISQNGSYKLAFLLFDKQTNNYSKNQDYYTIAEEKLEGAYRELHLWINVK